MKPEGSLPRSQEPATFLYPDPDRSVYQISYPFSIAQVVPKDQSESKAHVSV